MTRIVSYNILAGGYSLREKGARRTEQLLKIIRSAQPDVVGLPEAINQQVSGRMIVEDLADALGMQLIKGGKPSRTREYQTALLTRLPVVYTKNHDRPGVLARPLLEVCVEEENGQHLTIFVVHLSAAFNHGWAGGGIRMREMHEILQIMAPLRAAGKPHLLMGDFNSLAPKDAFTASALLKYVVAMDDKKRDATLNDGNPYLDSVVPPNLRMLRPLLRLISKSDFLCSFFDIAATFYAPRGCIRLLEAEYEDSFRYLHPMEQGYTCPAAAPAGRIDYIFMNKTMADRLNMCRVLTMGEDDLPGDQASDHLAITAEFGAGVVASVPASTLDNVTTTTH
jgi:endonuclease/exonuclease/phosphatase family metal-dependent hydrolase